MLKRVLYKGLILSVLGSGPMPALAECRAAFPMDSIQILEGHTIPGIKNNFADPVRIKLGEPSHEGAGVDFGEGMISASRLTEGAVAWSGVRAGRWGNRCFNLPDAPGLSGPTALLILSWDPDYHHPNVHGLITKIEDEWVFRGFLDNAAQQFHEAAIELRWSYAR